MTRCLERCHSGCLTNSTGRTWGGQAGLQTLPFVGCAITSKIVLLKKFLGLLNTILRSAAKNQLREAESFEHIIKGSIMLQKLTLDSVSFAYLRQFLRPWSHNVSWTAPEANAGGPTPLWAARHTHNTVCIREDSSLLWRTGHWGNS